MLSEQNKKILHDIAYRSIEQGLSSSHPLTVDLSDYDESLCEKKATFVTLKIHDQLRGCIGILEPLRPLVEDVAYNAFAAAYKDSRFNPVNRDEIPSLSIHISILNTPEAVQFDSEQDMLQQLEPGKDGIILIAGFRKATFLPSVWESVKSKTEFIEHLKQKAGLDKHYWNQNIKILRYGVDEF
jgi:AmmeMemoRadiSam system protein A